MTVSDYVTLVELVHEGAQARAAKGDGKAETLPARLVASLMSSGRARDILKIKAAVDVVYGRLEHSGRSLAHHRTRKAARV